MHWTKNYFFCFVLLIIFLFVLPNRLAAYQLKNKRILVLNSYHAGYQGSDDIVTGFSEKIRQSLPAAEIKLEYLDSKQYSGPEFDRRVLDFLDFKYHPLQFDLLVATDDYAFNILEQHRDELFGTVPVVFCGTNDFDPARLRGKSNFIGIDERPSFSDNLELIFRLHPGTTQIIVIHDDSITAQHNIAAFREAAVDFESKASFTYRAGNRLDELIAEVGQLQSGTVLFYFSSFLVGANAERMSSDEVLKALANASPVPIYGGWKFNLGKGIIGGRLIDLEEHGRVTADLALRVLRQEFPSGQGVLLPSPNKFIFDYAQMSRFGISRTALPAGSGIINRPPDFYATYGNALWAIFSAILALLVGIISVKLLKRGRQLKRSEIKFSTIFRMSPDMNAITEKKSGKFLDVNDTFERSIGFTREETVGRTSAELNTWGTDEERKKVLNALGDSTRLMNFETLFRRRNNEVFTVLLSLEVTMIEGTECLIISARDITDHKQAEAELQAAKEAAEAGNRAKSEFLTNMSHEIRTPMTIFMMAIEHLLEIDHDPDRHQFLELADKSAQRLRTLIENILDLSRIEARKVDIKEESFDLRTCVRSAVDMFALSAREKNLGLEMEVGSQVPERIVGDPGRVEQVLINLIGNAVKFTHEGEIRVCVQPRGEFLAFYVADTGIGIPQEKCELLFQNFTQVDSSFSRQYGGSGLGLAISKGLVELMGGEISVRNQEGKGSVFTFILPLKTVAKQSPRSQTAAKRSRPDQAGQAW